MTVFDELEMHSGGGANNTAITLAKLGINVGAMGRIGTDTFGDFVLQILDDNRVDTRAMMRDTDTNTPPLLCRSRPTASGVSYTTWERTVSCRKMMSIWI